MKFKKNHMNTKNVRDFFETPIFFVKYEQCVKKSEPFLKIYEQFLKLQRIF